MASLRTLTQPISSKDRIAHLRDQCNTTHANYCHNRNPSKRCDSNGIKFDTECWIRSYRRNSQDSSERSNGKYRLSRLLNVGRNYFNKANLRKRLAGVTCFHYKQQTNPIDELLPKPTLRSYTSSDLSQSKVHLDEDFGEKQDPKFGIRINVKPTSFDASSDLSRTSTISSDDVLRPARTMKKKKSKPRKVTTYYSSETLNTRRSRGEVYYSVQRGKRNSIQQCSFRAVSNDKKAVGRHLEWLKFLA